MASGPRVDGRKPVAVCPTFDNASPTVRGSDSVPSYNYEQKKGFGRFPGKEENS